MKQEGAQPQWELQPDEVEEWIQRLRRRYRARTMQNNPIEKSAAQKHSVIWAEDDGHRFSSKRHSDADWVPRH